jgi:hypothetical protein
MSLVKNKGGNFYPVSIPEVGWNCDYLWSTHRGCPFDCVYCSSKRLNNRFKSLGDPTIPKRLKGEWKNDYIYTKLPINSSIFISPYNDIMSVGNDDIRQILDICNQVKSSSFILQTKNPTKYFDYIDLIPEDSWLGTTIETDLYMKYADWKISKSPNIRRRKIQFKEVSKRYWRYMYFVTIEPVLTFSKDFIYWIDDMHPDLIFIGANTSKIQLPEPTNDELIEFIYALYDTIGVEKVYLKSNIRRLIPAFYDGWKLAKEQNEVANANNKVAS